MSAGNNCKESLVGFLVGAVLGTATVLLLTPKTGGQIRESLIKEARRLIVKASRMGAHPNEWGEFMDIETGKDIVNNIERIRAAGL